MRAHAHTHKRRLRILQSAGGDGARRRADTRHSAADDAQTVSLSASLTLCMPLDTRERMRALILSADEPPVHGFAKGTLLVQRCYALACSTNIFFLGDALLYEYVYACVSKHVRAQTYRHNASCRRV